MSIFKACDVRGIYNKDLDDDIAYRLGQALGMRLQGQRAVVGGDLRLSTPPLKDALIRGMMEAGVHVLDVGIVPTPTLYWARIHLKAQGAVMVTASHNPAEYNGFKFMLGALPIAPEEIEGIAQDVFEGLELQVLPGTIEQRNILDEYETFLITSVVRLKRRRVVVDAGNGSLSEMAPRVLAHLGLDVVPLFCSPDGSFPNRDPNPAVPEHIETLCREVVSSGADLGIAYDGDGDRVIFCDHTGQTCTADRVFVLYIDNLLKKQPGAGVVYDQKCSEVVPEAIVAHGGIPLVERSGHAFIKRRLLDEDAALGGEISGHYFFQELQGDDALFATLRLLAILDKEQASLYDLLAKVPQYVTTPDIRIPCPPDMAANILQDMARSLADYPQQHIDGVRIQFPDGWALARLSVTEPLLTLRCEAHTDAALERIKNKLCDSSPALHNWLAQIGKSL